MARRAWSGAAFACCLLTALSQTAQAQSSAIAGPYLAARAAGAENDFGAASQWFLRALEHDPTNPALIDNCLLALVGLGDLERAAPVAGQAMSDQVDSQLAHMVAMADAAFVGDWARLIENIEAGHSVGQRVDVLAHGWALLGQGEAEAALAAFDAAADLPGSRGFGMYHKAMALGMLGRFEEADTLLLLPPGDGVPRTRRSVIAHIQIMTQLGRNDDALQTLDAAFGRSMDPATVALRQAIATGGIVPFDMVTTPAEGIAEVFYTEGRAYVENSPPAIVLLYAQIARILHPGDAEMIMLAAGLLDELERYGQAAQTFALVPRDNPAFHSAEFGRADALRQAGQTELAIEVLQSMLRGYPDLAMAHAELGDILRIEARFGEAEAAYSDAIALVPPQDRRHWLLRYKRGITLHQLDNWDAAETDFRAALELNPGHAGLLNYLGYSLIERGEKLDEAFDMISRAIAAEPDNGAIVDSLAWAYFSLGRYDEAVEPMERAAALLPEDPVILDHLGDVYYAVGRTLEANFQWSRALSFSTDEELSAAIRAKLENGLQLCMKDGDDMGEVSVARDQ